MSDPVIVETRDGVRTIRMNRPEKKNALTAPMYAAMAEAIRAAGDDPGVGALLIAGSPGAFSAGNDVTEFVAAATSGALGAPILDFLRALATTDLPLVAGVDGVAVGVGATMLLHCDVVIASDRSTFRAPFTDLGLVPEAGSTLIGPRMLGYATAFEFLIGGAGFDAARAREAGLVGRVVAPEALEAEAFAAALAIAAKPRRAVALARRLMKGDPAELLARIDEEAEVFADRLRSSEAQAAFKAFLQKRA